MAVVVEIVVSFDVYSGYFLHMIAVFLKTFPAEIANKENNSVAVVVEIAVSVDMYPGFFLCSVSFVIVDLGFLPFV